MAFCSFCQCRARLCCQISNIEELLKKLRLIKKEREQVLKDLKDKVCVSCYVTIRICVDGMGESEERTDDNLQAHNDDISNVLILNKKSIANQDSQIFKAELEKFRPHQNRILQANHKQNSLLKEITRTYDALLQDKRVRAEHSKFEAFSRQRNSALSKYRRVYQAFNDLVTGLSRAQAFYTEMKDTVESLNKNVDTFVNNRKSEGGQLLSAIENAKNSGQNGLVDWERERLQQLMDRMSVNPSSASSGAASPGPKGPMSASSGSSGGRPPFANPPTSPPAIVQQYAMAHAPGAAQFGPPSGVTSLGTGYLPRQNGSGSLASPPPQGSNNTTTQHVTYNPASWGPVSPPPQQQFFSQNMMNQPGARFSQQSMPAYTPHQQAQPTPPQQGQGQMPPGWQPPPPPPGAPPTQQDMNFGIQGGNYPSGPGGYAGSAPRAPTGMQQQPSGGGGDPWSGLSGWK